MLPWTILAILIISILLLTILSSNQAQQDLVDRIYKENMEYLSLQKALFKHMGLVHSDTSFIYRVESTYPIEVSIHPWGLFRAIQVKSLHSQMGLQAFIGAILPDLPDLDLNEVDYPLRLLGDVIVEGSISMPQKGFAQSIGQHPYTISYQNKHESKEEVRWDLVHQLTCILPNDPAKHQFISRTTGIVPKELYVSFSSDTLIFFYANSDVLMVRNQSDIKGRVVLLAQDRIDIGDSANLEDLILISPNINVGNGCQLDAVQLFARDTLIIGESCHLRYPSCLISGDSDSDGEAYLEIGIGSRIEGLVYQRTRGAQGLNTWWAQNTAMTGYLFSDGKATIPPIGRGCISLSNPCVLKNGILNEYSFPQMSLSKLPDQVPLILYYQQNSTKHAIIKYL